MTTRIMPDARHVAMERTLGALFALGLAVSAVGKLLAPGRAVDLVRFLLPWGLSHHAYSGLVVSGAALQLVLAVLVGLFLRSGVISALGLAVVCAMGALGSGARLAGFSGECGCFGELPVPAWVPSLVIASGAAWFLAVRPGGSVRLRRGVTIALVWPLGAVAVYSAAQLTPSHASKEAPEADWMAELSGGPAVAIVVSPDCDHCCRLVRDERARLLQAAREGVEVVLLMSEPADAGCMANLAGGLRVRIVPRSTWWDLVSDRPPTVLAQPAGGSFRRASSLRDALALARRH